MDNRDQASRESLAISMLTSENMLDRIYARAAKKKLAMAQVFLATGIFVFFIRSHAQVQHYIQSISEE